MEYRQSCSSRLIYENYGFVGKAWAKNCSVWHANVSQIPGRANPYGTFNIAGFRVRTFARLPSRSLIHLGAPPPPKSLPRSLSDSCPPHPSPTLFHFHPTFLPLSFPPLSTDTFMVTYSSMATLTPALILLSFFSY